MEEKVSLPLEDTSSITKSNSLTSLANFASLDDFQNSGEQGRHVLCQKEKIGKLNVVKSQFEEWGKNVEEIINNELYYPECTLIRLNSAKIHAPTYLIHTNEGDLLSDLSIWRGKFRSDMFDEANCAFKGQYGIIANNNFMNFSHWHTEMLPATVQMRNIGLFDKKFIFPNLDLSFHRPTLHAFGITMDDHLQIKNGVIDVEKLVYCSYLDHSRGKDVAWPKEILNISDRLSFLASRQEKRKWPKIFYLSRRDSQRRKCMNELELEQEFAKMGIVSIIAGKLTYYEQVSLFKDADAIIALHGAGLNNIMFCRPETLIIEAQPPRSGNTAFLKLAAMKGLNYALYQEEDSEEDVVGEFPKNRHRDWNVNITKFANFSKECLDLVGKSAI